MPNYQNSKIYKIVSDQVPGQYIGSTTSKLSNRMSGHRTKFRAWKAGKIKYICKSNKFLEHDDAKIILIENYPCTSKEELVARESYWQQQMKEGLSNIVNPIGTRNEWVSNNKDRIKELGRSRYKRNKEEMNAQSKRWREENRERYNELCRNYRKRQRDLKNNAQK